MEYYKSTVLLKLKIIRCNIEYKVCRLSLVWGKEGDNDTCNAVSLGRLRVDRG